jgi:flagellar protein FliS
MRAVANPYEKYKQQDVLMANPVELIIMLYDGCIKQLKLTKIAISDAKIENVNTCLQKAQDIIMELIMSLDLHYDMANELLKIYQFIIDEMVDINITKDETKIDPLVEILSDLKKSWQQVLKESKLIESIG